MKRAALLFTLCLTSPTMVHAGDHAMLITYGPRADAREGDDRFYQVLRIDVPKNYAKPLFVRIYDADCGGDLDQAKSVFDTTTRMRIFGGPGSTRDSDLRSVLLDPNARGRGTVLANTTFGASPALDQKWHMLAKLSAADGDIVGDRARFKLVVEGLEGNDGNAFDVEISAAPDQSVPIAGVDLLSFAPTLRLNDDSRVVELRFVSEVPTAQLAVHLFDLGGAQTRVETTWASYPVTLEDTEGWHAATVKLDAPERRGAVVFGGGHELPNDVSLYVTAEPNILIPVIMPFTLHRPNVHPEATPELAYLSDCKSVAVDGAKSRDADGDALHIAWSFGDGETMDGARLTHTYADAAPREATLTVQDMSGTFGDSARKNVAVRLNTPPQAHITGPELVAPGVDMEYSGATSQDVDGPIKAYTWDFGDGHTGSGARATHAFKEPGRYKIALGVIDAGAAPCNTGATEQFVRVNAGPTARITTPRLASPGQEIELSAQRSDDTDGKLVAFAWNFGDGTTGKGDTLRHRFANPGTYKVVLTVRDDAAVANSEASTAVDVHINTPPEAHASVDTQRAAVGQVLHFDAGKSLDADGRIERYIWEFGDGGRSDGQAVTYAYQQAGVFKVTLTVDDDSGTSSKSHSVPLNITVNHPPEANAGGDRVVLSSEVAFDATASRDTDGRIKNYLWTFGDGTTASGPKTVHVFGNTGVYPVTLKVVDDSGTPSDTGTTSFRVHVNAMPIADAGWDRIVAPGEAVSLSGSESFDPDGRITNYQWDFSDGGHAAGETVQHAFAAPGVFSVRLAVKDDSGRDDAQDFDALTVRVNAPPLAVAGTDARVAPGDQVTFDASRSYDPDGKILAYHWDLGGREGRADTAQVAHQFKRPGVYTAVLTVVDDSGARNAVATATRTVWVNHAPHADAGPDIATCDTTLTFDGAASSDADGDRLGHVWDFGDGSPKVAGVRVQHTYARGGTYPVTLHVDDGTHLSNSSGDAAVRVRINQPAVAAVGADKIACAGEVVLFNGSGSRDPESGKLKYHWDLGEGATASDMNPTKVYSKGGTYQVALTTDDDSGLACSGSTAQMVVRVAESPVAKAGPEQNVCANSEVHFDGTASHDADGLVNAFAWDFGDGQNGGGATPSHVYTAPGTYRINLTVTGDLVGDCDNTARDMTKVNVFEAPTAKFTVPKIVALDTPIVFDANNSASKSATIIQYAWDFGDGEKMQGVHVEHAFHKPGKYLTALAVRTDAVTSCNTTSVQNLVVANAPPVADAAHPALAGVNDLLLFNARGSRDADGSLVSYSWDFGDGQTGRGVEARHQYKEPGRYKVLLRVVDDTTVANNSAEHTSEVRINATPVARIAALPPICAGTPTTLSGATSSDADGPLKSFGWTFGDGQTGTGIEPKHTYAVPGRYEAALSVDDGAGVSNSRAATSTIVAVNNPPVAHVSAPRIACPNESIAFDASGTRDVETRVLAFAWDFGDKTQGTGDKVTHAYATPGRYTAKLVATDDSKTACATGTTELPIVVNAPPVAVAGGDRTGYAGGAHDAVLFDATASNDPDGGQLTYTWDFGDGTSETGAKVFHPFLKAGVFTVRLRVEDDSRSHCADNVQTVQVTVREHSAQ